MKICKKCMINKNLSEYGRDIRRKDGHHNDCKICKAAYSKKYRTTDKGIEVRKKEWHLARESGRQKGWNLSKNYWPSLSWSEAYQKYKDMYNSQNGKCAICLKPEKYLRNGKQQSELCVDHCHATGKTRGLLCNQCNRAIGFFEDKIDVVRNSFEYLLMHQDFSPDTGGLNGAQ